MKTTHRRRRGAAMAVVGILVVAAVTAPAAQRRRADNSIHGTPVATTTIAKAPERYYGQLVTVSASVEEVLSKTLFVVDQRKAAGLAVAAPAGAPLLVIAPHLAGALTPNRYFLVRGEVVKLSPELLAPAASDTPAITAAVLATYAGKPVLVASSVIDSKYVELTKAP